MYDIVENSYYDHDEHGTVKVVDVTNGVVSFEKKHEQSYISGVGRIPTAGKQSAAGFRDQAEPADVTVAAQAAVLDFNAFQA